VRKGHVWLAVVFIITGVFFGVMLYSEMDAPVLYYEDVVSGEYDGYDVYVTAKAYPIAPYYNARYEWAIKAKDGEYYLAGTPDDRWYGTVAQYEGADEEIKNCLDRKLPVLLKLYLRSGGSANISEIHPADMIPREAAIRMLVKLAIGVVGAWIVVVIIVACLSSAPPTKSYKREPVYDGRNVRTITSVRILDSTGPTYGSRTSTTSAVGRAIVGDMIAGPTGAFIGAATAKQKTEKINDGTMTFRIIWSDGSQTTETVTKGSAMYKKLIDMVP